MLLRIIAEINCDIAKFTVRALCEGATEIIIFVLIARNFINE